jgi:amidohydrolase
MHEKNAYICWEPTLEIMKYHPFFVLCTALVAPMLLCAQPEAPREDVWKDVKNMEEQVIAWRRDIHEHPELGNRELRTAGLVADHLRSLGM